MQKDKSWGFGLFFFLGIFTIVCAVSTKLYIFCHSRVNFGEFCESIWNFDRTERGDESDEVPYCSSIDDFAFPFCFCFFFANFLAFREKFISPSLKVVWFKFFFEDLSARPWRFFVGKNFSKFSAKMVFYGKSTMKQVFVTNDRHLYCHVRVMKLHFVLN